MPFDFSLKRGLHVARSTKCLILYSKIIQMRSKILHIRSTMLNICNKIILDGPYWQHGWGEAPHTRSNMRWCRNINPWCMGAGPKILL
jgi:hypothetical protein